MGTESWRGIHFLLLILQSTIYSDNNYLNALNKSFNETDSLSLSLLSSKGLEGTRSGLN